MHKVIEHVFARLKPAFKKQITSLTSKQHPYIYWGLLTGLFIKITPSSVARDVASLRATYKAIVDRDGAWADKKNR